MRTISDKIQTDAGRYYARLVWAEGELSGDTIKSITVTAAINASSERLTLGATPAAQLTASVVTDSNLLNRQVQLLIGRGGEEVSIGVYTITNATVADGVATLSGYDAMYIAMERGYYPTITGATDARAVLADVAKAAGVKLVLPDGLNATVSGVQTGSTLREMAGYMAALLGCNARIDGDGALCVQWFTPCAVTLNADHIYSGGASMIGEDWVLGNLTCSVATRKTVTDADGITSQLDSDTTLISGTGATGVSFSNVWMTQNLLDELYQRIGGLTYRGGELSVLGDLRIEPGDLITVDILEGKPVQFPVMAQTLEYDGGLKMTLNAYAESESDGGGNGVNGPLTQAVERYAAELAVVRKLDADNAKITHAQIRALDADKASVTDLSAAQAQIKQLEADKLSAADAELKYANIDFSNIGKAAIEQFYATSGIIKNLVIGDSTITGELVGVTIRGDLIEGGTVVADKLVVKGEDGLYYKLNTDGVTTEAQQTDYNSLSGQIIRAKSITASKIAVDDLVAIGATIGGFHLTDSALYSGAKASPTNTTRGIYLDSTGQLCVGDSKSYLRYYKDSSGQYRLEIAAASMTLSTGQSVEAALEETKSKLDLCITTDPADRSKVISAINASADAIALNSNRLTIDSDNFKLAADGTVTATAGDIGGFKMRSKTVAGYGFKQRSLLGGYEADGKEYGLCLIPQSASDDWDSEIDFVNGSGAVALIAERRETEESFERFSITGAPLNPANGINISWYDGNGKTFRVDKDEAYAEVLRAGNLTVSSGATINGGATIDRLTKLPLIGQTGILSEDFNNYTTRGKFVQSLDGSVASMANRPCDYAGALYCIFPIAPQCTDMSGTWRYLVQIYIDRYGYVYTRFASTGSTDTISWGGWATYLHTRNLADYIVASGTSGIWTYIKYNSGIAVCYGKRPHGGVDTSSAWGNIYTSGANTISAIDYPFGFVESPSETVSMMCYEAKRSAWLVASETQNTTSKTATYEFARGTANWEDAVISYTVCGRWK